jgi:hypothetical protein
MNINNWDKLLSLAGVKKTSDEDSLLTEQYSKVDSKIQNIKKKIDDKLNQITKRKSLGKLDQRTTSLEGKLKVLQIKLQNHIKNKSTAMMDSEKYMRELENIEKSLTSNNDTQLEKSVDNVTISLKKDEVTPQVKAESLTPDVYVERGTVFLRGDRTEIVLDKLGSFYYVYEIDKGDYLPTQDRTKAKAFDEGMISREISKGTIKPTEETYKISASARINSKLLKASTGMNFKSMTPQQASNFVDKIVNDKIYIKLKGQEDNPFLVVKTSDGQYAFKSTTGKQSTTQYSKDDLVDGFVKGQLFEKIFVINGKLLLENEAKKITLLVENTDFTKGVSEISSSNTSNNSSKVNVPNRPNAIEQLDKLGSVHKNEKYTLGVLQAKLAALGYWQKGRPLSLTKDEYTKSVVKDFLQKNPNKSLKDLVNVDGYSDIGNFKPSGDKPVATSATEVRAYLSGSPTNTSPLPISNAGLSVTNTSKDNKKSESSTSTIPEVLEGYKRGTYGHFIISTLINANQKGYKGKLIVNENDIKVLLENIDDNIYYNNYSFGNMDDSDYNNLKQNPLWLILQNSTFIVKYGKGKLSTLQNYFLTEIVGKAKIAFTAINLKDEERFNFDSEFPDKTQSLFINSVNRIAYIARDLRTFDQYLKTISSSILDEKIDEQATSKISLGLKNFKGK